MAIVREDRCYILLGCSFTDVRRRSKSALNTWDIPDYGFIDIGLRIVLYLKDKNGKNNKRD